ncbi:hypothetical protein KDA_19670 [Dictyobacter alpinus]|uniref:Uncharacterized protein n=1 Tax=Dictyobacter alpinus TaxID=2014873 RepID=A0A402B560_9CHLR|nr:hypothetical protein KDA_19670 [Dictyobacter alpinus]
MATPYVRVPPSNSFERKMATPYVRVPPSNSFEREMVGRSRPPHHFPLKKSERRRRERKA